MEENYFLPSEIARLVLGYLKESNCKKSQAMFLRECADLTEYVKMLNLGREFPTNVAGKSLQNILQEYARLKLAESRAASNHQQAAACLWRQFDGLVTELKLKTTPKLLSTPLIVPRRRGRPRLSASNVNVPSTRPQESGLSDNVITLTVPEKLSETHHSISNSRAESLCIRRDTQGSEVTDNQIENTSNDLHNGVVSTHTYVELEASLPVASPCNETLKQTGVADSSVGDTCVQYEDRSYSEEAMQLSDDEQLSPEVKSQTKGTKPTSNLLTQPVTSPPSVTGALSSNNDSVASFPSVGALRSEASNLDKPVSVISVLSSVQSPCIRSVNLEQNSELGNTVESKGILSKVISPQSSIIPSTTNDLSNLIVDNLHTTKAHCDKEDNTDVPSIMNESPDKTECDKRTETKDLDTGIKIIKPNTPVTLPPVRQCENAIDSFEQAKAMGIGCESIHHQVLESKPAETAPAFTCISTLSAAGLKTPIKNRFPDETSSSRMESESHKGRSPRRKKFAPRRTMPADNIHVPKPFVDMLNNSELHQKLASSINRTMLNPLVGSDEVQTDEQPGLTSGQSFNVTELPGPSSSRLNCPSQVLDSILDLHETQMSGDVINDIIESTKKDPAFEGLFNLFDINDSETYVMPCESEVSLSTQMCMELDKEEQRQAELASKRVELPQNIGSHNLGTSQQIINSNIVTCQKVTENKMIMHKEQIVDHDNREVESKLDTCITDSNKGNNLNTGQEDASGFKERAIIDGSGDNMPSSSRPGGCQVIPSSTHSTNSAKTSVDKPRSCSVVERSPELVESKRVESESKRPVCRSSATGMLPPGPGGDTSLHSYDLIMVTSSDDESTDPRIKVRQRLTRTKVKVTPTKQKQQPWSSPAPSASTPKSSASKETVFQMMVDQISASKEKKISAVSTAPSPELTEAEEEMPLKQSTQKERKSPVVRDIDTQEEMSPAIKHNSAKKQNRRGEDEDYAKEMSSTLEQRSLDEPAEIQETIPLIPDTPGKTLSSQLLSPGAEVKQTSMARFTVTPVGYSKSVGQIQIPVDVWNSYMQRGYMLVSEKAQNIQPTSAQKSPSNPLRRLCPKVPMTEPEKGNVDAVSVSSTKKLDLPQHQPADILAQAFELATSNDLGGDGSNQKASPVRRSLRLSSVKKVSGDRTNRSPSYCLDVTVPYFNSPTTQINTPDVMENSNTTVSHSVEELVTSPKNKTHKEIFKKQLDFGGIVNTGEGTSNMPSSKPKISFVKIPKRRGDKYKMLKEKMLGMPMSDTILLPGKNKRGKCSATSKPVIQGTKSLTIGSKPVKVKNQAGFLPIQPAGVSSTGMKFSKVTDISSQRSNASAVTTVTPRVLVNVCTMPEPSAASNDEDRQSFQGGFVGRIGSVGCSSPVLNSTQAVAIDSEPTYSMILPPASDMTDTSAESCDPQNPPSLNRKAINELLKTNFSPKIKSKPKRKNTSLKTPRKRKPKKTVTPDEKQEASVSQTLSLVGSRVVHVSGQSLSPQLCAGTTNILLGTVQKKHTSEKVNHNSLVFPIELPKTVSLFRATPTAISSVESNGGVCYTEENPPLHSQHTVPTASTLNKVIPYHPPTQQGSADLTTIDISQLTQSSQQAPLKKQSRKRAAPKQTKMPKKQKKNDDVDCDKEN